MLTAGEYQAEPVPGGSCPSGDVLLAYSSGLLSEPELLKGAVDVRWDVALRDLDHALGIDDGDGKLTWGEVRGREERAAEYVRARLVLSDGARLATLERAAPVQVAQHSDGAYAVFRFRAPIETVQLTVTYSLFFDLDPEHRLVGERLERRLARANARGHPVVRIPVGGTDEEVRAEAVVGDESGLACKELAVGGRQCIARAIHRRILIRETPTRWPGTS